MYISVLPQTQSGLGMTKEDAIALLSTGNGTPEELAAANAAYYGAGGYYSQEASVMRAQAESGVMTGDYGDFPTPQLYVMEICDPRDVACVDRNAQRQQANMALIANASAEYNKRVCEADYAVNRARGGSSVAYNCGEYEQIPVPPAPGYTAPAVEVGEGSLFGQRSNIPTPMGGTQPSAAEALAPLSATQEAAVRAAAQAAVNRIPVSLPTSTGPAANQNVIPNTGAAGNVSANSVHVGPEAEGATAEDGGSMTLLIAAAAAAAFFLFKGRG